MPFTPSRAQVDTWKLHRSICVELGIPQVTLAHKKLKGTIGPQTAAGNYIYTGPAPTQDFSSEYESTWQVWYVTSPFIRGEEREEEEASGIQATPIQQGQIAFIDDTMTPVPITQDDFIIDPDGPLWRIVNPVVSPDRAFWTFLAEQQR